MAKKRNVFEDTGSDIKVHAAEKGAIEQGEASGRGAVAVWLWMLIILIVAMITVGLVSIIAMETFTQFFLF